MRRIGVIKRCVYGGSFKNAKSSTYYYYYTKYYYYKYYFYLRSDGFYSAGTYMSATTLHPNLVSADTAAATNAARRPTSLPAWHSDLFLHSFCMVKFSPLLECNMELAK